MELGFLTPELRQTYAKWLAACAEHVGVPVLVAPSVNQQALMDLADQLLRETGFRPLGHPACSSRTKLKGDWREVSSNGHGLIMG